MWQPFLELGSAWPGPCPFVLCCAPEQRGRQPASQEGKENLCLSSSAPPSFSIVQVTLHVLCTDQTGHCSPTGFVTGPRLLQQVFLCGSDCTLLQQVTWRHGESHSRVQARAGLVGKVGTKQVARNRASNRKKGAASCDSLGDTVVI